MKAILTFHSIDTSGSVLSFPPRAFACLLESLGTGGLPVLSLEELLLEDTTKGVAITFDDGMRSVFTAALPVLKAHAATAHLFLTTCAIGQHNRWASQALGATDFKMLDWNEIEHLHAAGVHIESHSHNHADLRKLSTHEIVQECELADRLIETRLGRRPQYFAYPYGYKNVNVCNAIRGRYKGAVTTALRVLGHHENMARLPRLDSYYLRRHYLHRHLDSSLTHVYLSLRSTLRSLRGTQ